MKIVKGNKLVEKTRTEFAGLVSKFSRVVIDLGCGDGRFVYKNALTETGTLWIGVEPAIKQLEEYGRKAARKKLENVLYVVGSLELMPTELIGVVNKVFIILPWGSLLGAIAKPTTENILNIKQCLKIGGELEVIFGYDSELEPTQTARFDLDIIDEKYIKNEIVPVFENCGFIFGSYNVVTESFLKNLESNWGKRISMRSGRPLSRLVFKMTL